MLRKSVGAGVSHQYIHRDHLGSITALTDEATGAVLQRFSYDAWGKRRSATDWTSAAAPTTEHRGYTGHEHLDKVGLIHMNGRIYSPDIARMLSPDPVTQAPENGQNYNRYTYAFNNPLKYTDPSGFSSDDKKTVCTDGCYQSGTPMGEVVVTGVRGGGNSPSLHDNLAGLSNWISMSVNNQLRAATAYNMRDQTRALVMEQDIQNGAIVATTQDGDLVDSDGNVISGADYFAQEGVIRRNKDGLIEGLNAPDITNKTVDGGLEGGGEMFGGIFGVSISTGGQADLNGNVCSATTACFKFGLGVYGGAGGEANLGVGDSLQTGGSDGWGVFIRGGNGAAAGGSINFGDGRLGAAKGFLGVGVGGAAGVQFCRTTLSCAGD